MNVSAPTYSETGYVRHPEPVLDQYKQWFKLPVHVREEVNRHLDWHWNEGTYVLACTVHNNYLQAELVEIGNQSCFIVLPASSERGIDVYPYQITICYFMAPGFWNNKNSMVAMMHHTIEVPESNETAAA